MQRPGGVPEEAFWSEDENEWCLAPRDEEGNFHGKVRWWRPDGTLCCETDFVHGTAEGLLRRFHENGEVSREGRLKEGALQGTSTFWRSTAETTEEFPEGLAETVWRAEMDYDDDVIVEARAFDRSGARVVEDGSPFPTEVPAGVPAGAHLGKHEDAPVWMTGSVRDQDGENLRTGQWRFWSLKGVLVAEESYENGELHGAVRTFSAGGELREETHYVEGVKSGPYLRHAEPGVFADARVVAERGQNVDGEAAGVIEYLDSAGQVVARIDTGDSPAQEAIVRVLEASPDSDFKALASELQGSRQYATAAFALARHAGRTGDVEPLRMLADSLRSPLSEEQRMGSTQTVEQMAQSTLRFGVQTPGFLTQLMNRVRIGGSTPHLLRSAATYLDDAGESALAQELIDAALLLAPSEKTFEFTRALVRMSLGQPERARESVQALASVEKENATFLEGYLAALFPRWDFWPAGDSRLQAIEPLTPKLSRLESRTTPSLARVRKMLAQVATRLGAYRERLVARFGEQPWLVPTVEAFIPGGPLEDVPMPQELEQFTGIGLNHLARRDWHRLTWLCWMAGLDTLGLPTTVAKRPTVPVLLACYARGMYLESNEVDLRETVLEAQLADEPGADAISALASELAPAQTWFGLRLEGMADAIRDFAIKDEIAVINAFSHWASEGSPLFDDASSEDEDLDDEVTVNDELDDDEDTLTDEVNGENEDDA